MSMQAQMPYMLTNEQAWLDWLDNIKSTAAQYQLWEFINPNISNPPSLPERPLEPSLTRFQRDARDYIDLDDTQARKYDQAYGRWERQTAEVKSMWEKYYALDQHIRATIAPQYQPLIRGKDGVHEKLRSLQTRFAANPYHNIRHLYQKWYNYLIKTPHSQNQHKWLYEWENFLVEVQNTGHTGLECIPSDWGSIFCFVDAIRPIDPTFAAQTERELQQNNKIKIDRVLNEYQGQLQGASGADMTSEATYATLGNISTSQQSSKKDSSKQKGEGDKDKGKPRRCFCGNRHNPNHCFYIVESARPGNWTPKMRIEAEFTEKRKNPALLAKLNEIRRQANLPEWTAPSELPASTTQSANMIGHTDVNGVFSVSSDTPSTSRPPLYNSFILDSGATTHTCNDFTRFTEFGPDRQWLAHGDTGTWIEGYGKIILWMKAPNGQSIVRICLGGVAYCPSFHVNIVSFPRLHDRGIFWDTERGLLYKAGQHLALVEKQRNLFLIENGDVNHSVNANIKHSSKPLISEASADTWHRRLGHVYYGSMAKLPHMVDGIAISDHQTDANCLTCELAKAKSQISRRPVQRARRPGERVHMDIIDNMIAYNGSRYCCHFMDDATRLHVVYILGSRQQAEIMGAIRAFVHLMKTQWSCKVAIFKLDGERALGLAFHTFCKEEGIEQIESLPYSPEQNGAIERAGKAISERARSLIIDAKIPKELWPEAYKAATYMLNRTPTQITNPDNPSKHKWIIPIQQMHALTTGYNVRPNLANLHVYGCRAYVKRSEQDIGSRHDKMEPRALIGYLVGFIASNIWRIWIPEQQQVVSARDVTFDESKQYRPDEPTHTVTIKQASPTPVLTNMPTHNQSQTQLAPALNRSATSEGVQQGESQSNVPAAVEDINDVQERLQSPPSQHPSPPRLEQNIQPQQVSPKLPQTQQAQPPPLSASSSIQPMSTDEDMPDATGRLTHLDEDAADRDEEMEDAPPLPEQQTPPGQLVVDEKMDGIEATGLSTPYTPGLHNIQTTEGTHHPTTPHQPAPLPMATPATPAINRTATLPQPLENSDRPAPRLRFPQAEQLPATPHADSTKENLPLPPATPNPTRFSWNEPTNPPYPNESTREEPTGPRDEIFGDPQDPRNIKTGSRPRRPRRDPDFYTYTTIQPAPMRQSEGVDDTDNNIMQAYALGLADNKQQQPTQRLHRSQLPPEPKDWQAMKRHQFRDEFTEAAHVEQQGLLSRGTYSVEETPRAAWLA